MFFESWFGLLRVVVVGPLAYAILVLVLRISGKRTLAKLNAFDLVVTVALGSTLSTVQQVRRAGRGRARLRAMRAEAMSGLIRHDADGRIRVLQTHADLILGDAVR